MTLSDEVSWLRALHECRVRFVAIGAWGANHYAEGAAELFATRDKDLFLPPEPDNLRRAWEACEGAGFEILAGQEPLDRPRDLQLARAVVEQRALTRANDRKGLIVDLTLVMAGFDFEAVWKERRTFLVDGVEVPVARLAHIVASKAAAGRPKDLLFLEAHRALLRDLLEREGGRRG